MEARNIYDLLDKLADIVTEYMDKNELTEESKVVGDLAYEHLKQLTLYYDGEEL